MQTYVHTVVYVSAGDAQEIGDTKRIAFNSMAFYKVRLRKKNYTVLSVQELSQFNIGISF